MVKFNSTSWLRLLVIEIVKIPWEKNIESSSSPFGNESVFVVVSWKVWLTEKEGIGYENGGIFGSEIVDEKF